MNYVIAIITALAVGSLGLGLHKIDVDHINAKHAREMTAQADSLNKQCDKDKALTEKVSNDYQKNLAAHAGKLDDALRLYGDAGTCLALTASPASGHDGAAADGKPSGQGAAPDSQRAHASPAIPAQSFLKLIGEGEHYRLQLMACQEYVRMTAPEALQAGK